MLDTSGGSACTPARLARWRSGSAIYLPA